ncbi:hypothetical protein HYH03_009723 [Edaphochlamys debaryana]|uniref:Transcription factor CBF/NF-Y/archaeal histone domain-containing protein n=1 Tax=Edaphochlamys debaryana TaxID=47281 RepID=A0A835XZQ8_9CHLO|nr:hypothetical protein HYH03_009723 [Edaphochlamys debaryana]|eukprot:KAG2491993.1 hypothetical protein HYH03_009723 [Edaphochlamys debaryana]
MIASTANDICQEKRRSTVNADDVFNALSDLDFPELVGPLREQLEAFREALKERNKNRPAKKRKGATYDAPLVVPRNPVAAADGNGDADEAAAAAGGGADSDVNGADDDGAAGGLRDTDGDDGDGPGVLGGGATTDDDGLGALGMGLGLGSGLGGVDGDGDGDLVENMLVDGPP